MRPVFGVHDPHRDVMMRNVICVGFRPMTGAHFPSSTGSCALIVCTARLLVASFHTKARGLFKLLGSPGLFRSPTPPVFFQTIQIFRTIRTIHTVQTIEIALTDLFIPDLQHGVLRLFDPWFAFRHESCNCRL